LEKIRKVLKLKEGSRLFWLLQISGWFLFAAVFCLFDALAGRFTPAAFVNYGSAAAAGFLASLLLRLGYRRLKIRDFSVTALSLVVIGYSILAATLLIGLASAFRLPFWGTRTLASFSSLMAFLLRLIRWFIWLLAWSALYLAFRFWREWVVQREQTEKAMALAQAANLHMLQYRLNPHFLFNALNSIRALIAENKLAAKSMVTELSEFLRFSLVSRNYENVPLRDEIESIRHYFNVQKTRYENKLTVSFEVDPAAEDFPIASFLLYPLAENALKHGLATSPLPLQIQIQAGVQRGNLLVEVRNSGSWVAPAEKKMEGSLRTGLAIVRQRLADCYPNRHSLDIAAVENFVRIRMLIKKDEGE
jgi:two-component system LytT family sensor kinase